MAIETGISWATSTWSPSIGCTKCSMSCAGCYAARDIHTRMRLHPNPKVRETFDGLTMLDANGVPDWQGVVRLLPQRLNLPRTWRQPKRIFVGSMTDLFHASVPDAFLDDVFTVMEDKADWHTYMILTKRPERMRAYLNARWASCQIAPPNIEIGVTVEHAMYVGRIVELLNTRAALRFVSMEPLLSDVAMTPYLRPTCTACGATLGLTDGRWRWDGAQWEHACADAPQAGHFTAIPALDAVIVGGESGPLARRMDIAWARAIQRDCADAGVAFHFKQLGTALAHEYGIAGKGDKWDVYPESLRDLCVREWATATDTQAITRVQHDIDRLHNMTELVLRTHASPR